MKKLILYCAVSASLACLSFFSCASFVQTDGVSGRAPEADYRKHTIEQAAPSVDEEKHARALKLDKIELLDFLEYQRNLIEGACNVSLSGATSAFSRNDQPSSFTLKYNHANFINALRKADSGLIWIKLESPYGEDIAALVGAGHCLLGFANAQFDHGLADLTDKEIHYRYDGFTAITGVQRFKPGPGSKYSMEQPRDLFAFQTREGFGIKIEEGNKVYGTHFNMVNPPGKKGTWLFSEFYLALPAAINLPEFLRKFNLRGSPADIVLSRDLPTGELTDQMNYQIVIGKTESEKEKEKQGQIKKEQEKEKPPVPQTPGGAPR